MQCNDFRLIPLTGKYGRGKHAIVDAADYGWLTRWSWHLSVRGYPSANITFAKGHKRKIPMHRLLVEPPKGLVTDHINRDKLDNRRSNLRIVTYTENRRNSPGPGKWREGRSPVARPRANRGGPPAGPARRKFNLPVGCYIWENNGRWYGGVGHYPHRKYIQSAETVEAAAKAALDLYNQVKAE